MTPNALLNALNDDAITAAIGEAERVTSGEIRVFITHRHAPEPLVAAREQFHRLKMEKTKERNAVLIFIAPKSQTFALFGDVGIDEKMGKDAWGAIAHNMGIAFGESRWTEGLTAAIGAVGATLAKHFPCRSDGNPNELPNVVERG